MTGSPALWSTLQTGFQAAGFACLTVAAILELLALLGRGATAEARALQWTRAGFLLLTGALVAGGLWNWRLWGECWPLRPAQRWGLLSWLIGFAVLHVNRVKAFKGRPVMIAGVAGWALAAGTWLALW
jgi:ABC-type transport system involved in cytochrome c biogenesis permease subunit